MTAVDAAGHTSAASVAAPVTTPLADTTLPSTPTALTATSVSTSQVNLHWSAATDNVAVQGYKVYRNGVYVSTIGPIGSTSLSDTGLTNGTLYTLCRYGHRRSREPIGAVGHGSATTGPDTIAPSVPAGLAVNGASSTHLTLSWTASTDNVGVTGYKVFRSGVLVYLTGPTIVGATDWNVVPGDELQPPLPPWTARATSRHNPARFRARRRRDRVHHAADGYVRSVSGGWGTADKGGAWSGTTSAFAVTVGVATITLSSATNLNGYLTSVAAGDQEALVRVNLNQFATGSNSETWLYLRRQDTSNYYTARMIFTPAKQIQLSFSKTASGTTTAVGSGTSTLTHTASAWYWLRVQLSGTTSVNAKLRVWKVGTAEPSTWLVNATDATPPTVLRGTGYVGIRAQAAGTGPYPLVASYAAMQVGSIGSVASPDITIPSLPTGLAATVRSTSRIDLAWTASSDNTGVQSYRVYRNATLIATVASPQFADTGLVASTLYSYKVASVDAAGNASAQTSTVSATTQGADTTKPSVPSGLSATASAWNVVNLSWTASTDNVGVTRYSILRAAIVVSVVDGSVTSFTDHGTNGSTLYSYTVKASDAAGNTSNASSAKNVTTPAADASPPSNPTGLIATVASSTQVNLSWTASTDNVGVQGYKLYRNGTYVAAIGPIGSTSVSDTGLTSGTAYSYTVSAIDGAGNESGQSPIANATPAPDNIFPSIPTGLLATASAWNAVNLSWTPSTDNIGVTRYTVSRGGAVLSVLAGSTTTFTDRTTAPTTAYSYSVTAADAAGHTSAASVAAPVTTPYEVQVVSPEAAVSVFGTESLSAFVSTGTPQVSYTIDGNGVGSSGVAPYTVNWDTTALADGNHTIVATAQAGNDPPVSSAPVTFIVANALDPATKVATDYSRGLISADSYALNEAYGLVAPTELAGRYAGTDTPEGSGLAEGLLGVLPQASQATQDAVNALLGQPLKGTMYAPAPGATYGRVDPNYPECTLVTQRFGGTTNYCQHTSTHFRISYVLGGGAQQGPDDVSPTDTQNADLAATGCTLPDHCNGVPDYIDHITKALEEAWGTYMVTLGYDQPISGSGLVEVSVHNIGGATGQVIPPFYVVEISNSSAWPMYLARHEFFHRVQWYSYMPNLLGLALNTRCPPAPPDIKKVYPSVALVDGGHG